ncbi:hypothetical protein [Saccharococcus caldoxylosilyticus]|nr:hypothetical protein [Parageobacillus caldoxylosilyticus]
MLIRPSQFSIYDTDKMVVFLSHHYRLGASAAKLTGDGFVKFYYK